MTTEIERTPKMNDQPNPMQVLQTMVGLQAITLGFLVTSQIMINRQMRKMSIPVSVNVINTPTEMKDAVS